MNVFHAMGCEVVVAGATPQAFDRIVELFAAREQTFSRFRPDSELSRVNAEPAGAVAVSERFAGALRQALAAFDATGGLVDPTLGAALAAAGYDRDLTALVADDPRPAGAASPGRRHEVRLLGRVLVRPPGLQLDLNGVVKGMTVDEAAQLLPGDGFVSAGGDLRVRGAHVVALPGGGAVTVRSGGLATSGTARRAWSRAGVPQHHLLDPRTGRPSGSRWSEVTVSASSCLAADVAAKAAFLLDGDGPAWLDERSLPGRFTTATGAVVENEAWRTAVASGVPAEAPA